MVPVVTSPTTASAAVACALKTPSGTPRCRNPAVSPRNPNPARRHHSTFSTLSLFFLAATLLATTTSAFQLPFFSNPSLSTNTTATMSAQAYSLPPLPYAYDALEPAISAQIMRLHHSAHHQTYITNLNAALTSLRSADLPTQIALQEALRFNAGGHINHSLFWENLAPANSSDAVFEKAAPQLAQKVVERWGSEEGFRKAFGEKLLGIKGSGWGWLVRGEGGLAIVTTKDQDPIVGPGEVPILGVDMWEHAYYLQYQNGKAAYVQNIWSVINWKVAEERFLGTREDAFKVLKASI